jgi:hypothetical protein
VWRYLQVAVDPLTGQLWRRWSARLGRAEALAALAEWRSLGVEVVWDNAGCHRARCVREAGVLYGTIEAKTAAVEDALEGLSGSSGGVLRLVGWDWIREALEGLSCD